MLVYAREIPGEPERYEVGPDSHFFTAQDGYLDKEDWGLTFDIEATPTGATVTCTQSGGQQIGQLSMQYYYLLNPSGSFLKKAEGTQGAAFEEIPIEMNGTTTFTIDWSAWYGALPEGSYYIEFDVSDLFDSEQVHPLMMDFHKRQLYPVSFTISNEDTDGTTSQ